MPERQAERLQGRGRKARSSAFAELHREYAAGVYNLALRLVGNRDDARDITQEVLLKAYQRLDGPRELQRSWFYKVTVNACYDHLRRVKARPQAADEPPELAAVVDRYEQADLLRQVNWTLRQLPPQQRAALLLREVHGLQYEEMADALGMQPESIGVTLTRARNTFKRHFAAVSGLGEAAAATASAGKRRVATALNGVAAFGFALPGFTLPQAPLPASLEASSLLAAATGVGVTGGGGAAIGVLAKIAAAMTTKAAVVGAGATLVTGGIGGVYAVEHAHKSAAPEPAPAAVQKSSKPAAAGQGAAAALPQPKAAGVKDKPAAGGKPAVKDKPAARASAGPTHTPSPTAVPLPSETPTPSETAVAEVPQPKPSATTIGETPSSPTPTPTPPPPETPSPTPTTIGETSPVPDPSPSEAQ